MSTVELLYNEAKKIYAEYGVDTDLAIKNALAKPISIQCWQGDDVRGFESADSALTGGIQATGNYPGRARNIDELRDDFSLAASFVPGSKKISLHAIYLDNKGKSVARDEIAPEHFDSWIDWAKDNGYGVDFNPTCFSHKMSDDGLTLAHPDKAVRDFWIRHCIVSRDIAEYIGKKIGQTCVTNYWIPDGFKDTPVARYEARERLMDSYSQIFARPIDQKYDLDSVESKVFGIGAESCTIGSHEFYMGCALKHGIALTLDTGHFHPTEIVSDKISSTLLFVGKVVLHVSRPVRWDSDHVVIFDDELKAIASEIVRSGRENDVYVGLDFFDASINRVAAWTIGARNMRKALLYAYLEPVDMLKKFELAGDYTNRLAVLEEEKTLPFSAVWNMLCEMTGSCSGSEWLKRVNEYDSKIRTERA